MKLGLNREAIYRHIASLPKKINLVSIDKQEYKLIRELVKQDIIYYDISRIETTVKTQIPVYKLIALDIISNN